MLRVLLVVLIILAPASVAAGEPLFDAASKGDTVAIEQLLAKGEAVNSRARDQATPLIAAALAGQLEASKLLITKGADVMARNSGGFTALHAAAYSDSAPVASLLLENKAVLEDATNKAGTTPLFVAAEINHPEVVELLIAKGADATRLEAHGYSAMTRAFWKGHKDMVRLLKRHGLTCQEGNILTATEYTQCLAIN